MSPPRIAILFFLLLFVAQPAYAQNVPTVMNYQGRLTDNTPGQTPIEASVSMTFRIYNALMGGTLEWEEPWGAVPVTGGIFNVMLGSNGTPIPSSVFADRTRYLEIEVAGELLTPRQQLGSVGFAQESESSAGLNCIGCVGSNEIGLNAVGPGDIAGNAVGASEIVSNAVGNSEINNGANFTVSSISGNGAGLTDLNATNVTSGTLSDARLSGNIARENVTNTFLQDQLIEGSNFRYLIMNASTSGVGATGVILREAGSNRWFLRTNNSTDQLQLYSYGFGGDVLTSDFSTGNTRVRNLQMTLTTVLDVVTGGFSNTSPSCPAGTVRTGGGCRCGAGSLEKSYPSGSAAWYCECSVSTNVDAHAVCLESADP